MNWKEELDQLMSAEKIFNLKQINEELFKNCQEWGELINVYDDINSEISINSNRSCISIRVTPAEFHTTPFLVILEMEIDEKGLKYISIKCADKSGLTRFKKWEEKITDLADKEILLHTLNIRLKEYFMLLK